MGKMKVFLTLPSVAALMFIASACTTQRPPAHLSFDNETAQEIEVEIVRDTDSGAEKTILNMAPDEDADKEPFVERGDNDDSAMYVWPREKGGPDKISRDVQSITIRTERGCVFYLTADQLEMWAYGPAHRFWVHLTPERMSCSESVPDN